MKPKFRSNRFLAGSIALFITVSSAHAVPLTWDPGSGGTTDGAGAWLDTGKWWDGATNVDWTSGDAATFGNSGAGGAVTLASPTTAASITFNAFTGTYTLGTSGNAITLNSGITKNAGSAAVTFASPITLGGAQTWTNNSTGLLLTGNGTNLIDNGGNQLTIDGTGTTTFGVLNNAAVSLTGSGALVKNGSGRLNIGGVNGPGFSGAVTINGGILQGHNSADVLGNGNLTLNGGVLSFYWGVTYTRALGTSTSEVQILGGESGFAGAGTTGPTVNLGSSVMWGAAAEGSGATGFFNPSKFVLGDAGTGNVGATTFSSAIDLNGTTRTIVAPKGTSTSFNRSTISGAISNSTGTAGLIKEGGGYLLLSNNTSAWNGSTTVSEGFLDMGGLNLANIGDGVSRDITVASGAIVRFNALSNAGLNRIVETSDEIGVFTGSPNNNNLDFSSSTGANLPNAFLGSWAGNGAKAELGGTITPASDNYRLGYTGGSGALGIKTVLTGTQGLIVGGQAVVLAADNTYSGDTVVRNGGRLFIGRNLAMANSALDTSTGSLSLHDTIGGGGIVGVEKTDQPTLGGIFGNRDFAAPFLTTANQNNTTRLPLNQILGLTLNVGTGKTFTWTGRLLESSVGTYLTKTGDGTQVLDSVSTYTGPTTIEGGILRITNPYLDDASDVVIGSSAQLDLQFDESGGDVTDTVDTLTIGGVQQDAGIYGATGSGATTIDDVHFAGVGTLTVTSGPSSGSLFDTWAGTGTLGPVTFDGDTNGDGVQDGLAFLLGVVNPDDDAIGNLPVVTETAGGLVMTFDMLDSASRGTATLSVEHSSDLGISDAWTTVAVPDSDGGPTDGVTFVVSGSGTLDVEATIGVGEADAGKLFGRLKATE